MSKIAHQRIIMIGLSLVLLASIWLGILQYSGIKIRKKLYEAETNELRVKIKNLLECKPVNVNFKKEALNKVLNNEL